MSLKWWLTSFCFGKYVNVSVASIVFKCASTGGCQKLNLLLELCMLIWKAIVCLHIGAELTKELQYFKFSAEFPAHGFHKLPILNLSFKRHWSDTWILTWSPSVLTWPRLKSLQSFPLDLEFWLWKRWVPVRHVCYIDSPPTKFTQKSILNPAYIFI